MSNYITKIRALGAVFILALAFIPFRMSPAFAQGTVDPLTVQAAIERTAEVIRQVGALVGETRSEKGRISLRSADALQDQAEQQQTAGNYRLAYRFTLRARTEAWHAMSLARSDMRTEESLARVAEEAHERIATVRDLMVEGGVRDEQGAKLLHEAQDLLDKSRMNSQQNRYQLAFRLATNARQLAIRAQERVRNTRRLKESVERRIMLMERLVVRSRERVNESDNEKVRAEIRAAERKLEQSRVLLAAGRYDEARRTCEACEQMLRGVVRSLPHAGPGDPLIRLEEAHRLLERSREMAETGEEMDNPRITVATERAGVLLERAGELIGAGRAEEGIEEIDRAREMLRAAVREEQGALTGERIMTRMALMETLREQTRNLADGCPVPGARELLARADAHLVRAREHAGAARFESAAAEAAIARNMYQRIGDLCAR